MSMFFKDLCFFFVFLAIFSTGVVLSKYIDVLAKMKSDFDDLEKLTLTYHTSQIFLDYQLECSIS